MQPSAPEPNTYWYLAGPMTGAPGFNFPAFREARADLRARGYAVWCPAEADEAEGFDPWKDAAREPEYYAARDLPRVCLSSGVIVLPGWRGSAGAMREVTVAGWFGRRVLEYPTLRDVSHETILEEAQRLVYGDRQQAYGHPINDFRKTALLWTAWLAARGALADGAALEPEDVASMMMDVKRSRLLHAPKRDSLVDLAGYAATWALVAEERARRAAGGTP